QKEHGREGRHSSRLPRSRGALRLRDDVEDAFDEEGTAPRNLLELPPVLHRTAEADRHRGPRRAVHAQVRRADGGGSQGGGRRGNQAGSQGQEEHAGRRVTRGSRLLVQAEGKFPLEGGLRTAFRVYG